jgi:hypothetical protein
MAAPCDEENGIRLSVTVSEVLAVKSSWDRVMFGTYDPALTPRHVGELVGRTLKLHVDAISGAEFGPYLPNPTSTALTDADIERLYGGKRFIFTLLPPNGTGEPHWSGGWSLRYRDWAIKTMRRRAGSDCPELLEEHGRSFRGTPTADSPYRRALISQVEMQFAHLAEIPPGGIIVDQSLGAAREVNPALDEATWERVKTEVDIAAVSMMTERGSAFDLGLRTAFDPLSNSELRRLYADRRAAVEFAKALDSSAIDLGNANVLLDDAIKSVLEKHGFKVPP